MIYERATRGPYMPVGRGRRRRRSKFVAYKLLAPLLLPPLLGYIIIRRQASGRWAGQRTNHNVIKWAFVLERIPSHAIWEFRPQCTMCGGYWREEG